MPESTGLSPKGITKRISKNSIKGRGRRGSNTSSRKEVGAGDSAVDTGKDGEDAGAVTRSKRGGFLSFLNCCSAPENAQNVELDDQAVPAKKARILQPKPGRQATPMVKANPSAAESSNAESKEGSGEGIGGPEYSEHKPAAKPKIVSSVSKERVPTEKDMSTESNIAPVSPLNPEPPLPPLPPSVSDKPRDSTLIRPSAEPPQIVDPSETVAVQGTTINDRTPQQEQQDSDVAMTDAPPIAPVPDESTNAPQPQVNLPPPPPPPRNGQATTANTSNAVATTEQQKFLLPPLQSQHRGRKCLILDLDETLVHSSFKVRSNILQYAFLADFVQDPPPSRFYHTCRN